MAGTRHRSAPSTKRSSPLLVVLAFLGLIVVPLAACGSDESDGGAASTTPGDTAAGSDTTPPAPSEPDRPLVIAHRGASAQAPENTIAAFDRAVSLGAEFLELDLQMTADGVLVVLHDPILNRTARGPEENCTGPVDALTLEQLRSCDAGSWFNEAFPDLADPAFAELRIPTLDEVLDRYGDGVSWYIETKKLLPGEGMEEALVASLEAAGFTAGSEATDRIIVQSFDESSLRSVHALRPDLTLAQLISLGERPDESRLEQIAEYAAGITPNWLDVDAVLVAAAHASCLTVIPYTVDEPTDMVRLLDLGVHGLITNHPDLALPLVSELTAEPPCA